MDPETTSALALFGVIAALFNWWAGDRSVFGKALLLRRGDFFVAARWLGLGLWLASAVALGKQGLSINWLGLAGVVLLLVGTARRVG